MHTWRDMSGWTGLSTDANLPGEQGGHAAHSQAHSLLAAAEYHDRDGTMVIMHTSPLG